MCLQHLSSQREPHRLYRIFYYDCPPLTKRAHHPLTKRPIDFAKTAIAQWRTTFFEELKKHRKVALRLGYLDERSSNWAIRPEQLKRLLSKKIAVEALVEQDILPDIRQKGVDMRIGLDIASMAYKRQVDQMILISGDSDFVPAAKLARREGIDFILDPMWAPIRPDLHEHVDGLRSVLPKPPPRNSNSTG